MRQMHLYDHCMCLLNTHKAQGSLVKLRQQGTCLTLGTGVSVGCTHQTMRDRTSAYTSMCIFKYIHMMYGPVPLCSTLMASTVMEMYYNRVNLKKICQFLSKRWNYFLKPAFSKRIHDVKNINSSPLNVAKLPDTERNLCQQSFCKMETLPFYVDYLWTTLSGVENIARHACIDCRQSGVRNYSLLA